MFIAIRGVQQPFARKNSICGETEIRSLPRNLATQRFSRPPQSATLSSFRGQKHNGCSVLPAYSSGFRHRQRTVRLSAPDMRFTVAESR